MKTLAKYFPLFIILTRRNFFRYVCTRYKTKNIHPQFKFHPRVSIT